eukprot:11207181-Lingulodinium_polyedra.AAC.1
MQAASSDLPGPPERVALYPRPALRRKADHNAAVPVRGGGRAQTKAAWERCSTATRRPGGRHCSHLSPDRAPTAVSFRVEAPSFQVQRPRSTGAPEV